jgi:hypothetical protein
MRETSRIRLAQMYFRVEAGRQVILYIAFPDDAHGSSCRSFACLEDALVEKNLNAEGEKGGTTYHSSIR